MIRASRTRSTRSVRYTIIPTRKKVSLTWTTSLTHEGQLSPRVNAVWQFDPATSAHVGYARYFAPPSLQYVEPETLRRFAGTTNAPDNFLDSPTKVERAHYFVHVFYPHWRGIKAIKAQVDCINILDNRYQLRDGSGPGITVAQYGQRRTLLSSLSVDF